ncbi:uncharacterized protein LOC135593180 isoform X1 [Musa acuminata AAA Group]|uniref:uncharacterized protein LOC135593180 isoform X1 n=1 Tax=Musa acuminata AAA Group TaxID=214697 RepID=UPI0031DCB49A
MEPSLFASSPDKSELDLKSSFRKPTNDATSRKYQRHSPVGRSDSSSSGVNRSLVGFGGVGFLSTDQKKKLLWGNKKNNPTEESSSRWDLHLFQDLERQEKFNRLMSLSLPLRLWPIVGREGNRGSSRERTRRQRWKPPSKENRRSSMHIWRGNMLLVFGVLACDDMTHQGENVRASECTSHTIMDTRRMPVSQPGLALGNVQRRRRYGKKRIRDSNLLPWNSEEHEKEKTKGNRTIDHGLRRKI